MHRKRHADFVERDNVSVLWMAKLDALNDNDQAMGFCRAKGRGSSSKRWTKSVCKKGIRIEGIPNHQKHYILLSQRYISQEGHV
jgi:hypothetical protein